MRVFAFILGANIEQRTRLQCVVAHPTRRAIIDRLAHGSARISDVAAPFPMSLTGFCKHVRILEHAGLVKRTRHGRENTLDLSARPLQQVAEWVLNYERFWSSRMDRLEKFFVAKKEKIRMRLASFVMLSAISLRGQNSTSADANPPVSHDDIRIVRRARDILNSPGKWNRTDNRQCPANESTYSLYCALEQATKEISQKFEHRGAAMQQARFVIDDDLAKGNHYHHRLMDYNNDPKTAFADVEPSSGSSLLERLNRESKSASTPKTVSRTSDNDI